VAVGSSEVMAAVMAQKGDAAALFAALRAGSGDSYGEGVTRDTYGRGEEFAHQLIADRARRMGLEMHRDHAANLFMTLPGQDRHAARLMTGSHLDSVGNGGNFDGAAGVVAGLIAIRSLQTLGLNPRCDITTAAIRAEESVWFQVSYIGSRSAFGVLPPGALEAKRVDTGRTLADHMRDCGAAVEDVRSGKASLTAINIKAWVELHIEQAPQLVEAGMAVAVGTGVPGNFRYPQVVIRGEYAHVGLPRRFRRDAVLAASDFAIGLDELWKKSDAEGRPMAFTIGRFHTDPGEHALTKVAGKMSLSLDVRAYDGIHLAQLESDALSLARQVAERRGVQIDLGPRASADVAPSNPLVVGALMEAAAKLAIPTMRLASPASHDTATFAVAGVPTAMLFVRNANGSHNPRESMEISDFLQAVAVLTYWLAAEASSITVDQ
jgi:beta-ureidopropionase / N-carbamoyl-L-amino-acid hydrolase